MVGVTRGGVHTHTQPPTPKPYKLNPARSHHNSAPRRAEGGRPDATKKKLPDTRILSQNGEMIGIETEGTCTVCARGRW